jgi:hypothetical protein
VANGPRTGYLGLVAALLLAVTGCGAPSRPATTTPPMAPPSAGEPVVTDVPWLYSSPSRLFVFVAVLRNTTPRTLDRVRLAWTAYEANGRPYRSSTGERLPPLGAYATQYFVGGASGPAMARAIARVDARATADGTDGGDAATTLRSENVQLTGATPPQGRPGLSYRVTASLAVPASELNGSTLRTYVLLRDATGAIVGADWGRRESYPGGWPVLAPGTSFRFQDGDVAATAEATQAEVVGYVSR